ncbi:cytochrome P450 [Rhodococcus opacus]|uniref:cytochrome P450 n=1 Tax=Rhodococcus opacus TaxID=37919 RepID=UPI00200DFBB2|nr:cytochrome P450 [Rhodococcus opacus]MDX5962155.1 cytochrome P450 [Rhodococcus opacus]
MGAGFSLMEGTTVLREVLSRYALSLPTGAKPERGHVRNITDVPRHKAPIVITPRVGAHHLA